MKKTLTLLSVLLLVSLWLRWRYVQEISLYVDEFTTLWAAVQVQAHGAPIMPSGVLYTRGLLASYVEAGFLTLFGFSYTIGRLPSVLFGLATVVAIFVIGKREWRASVGWLAAVGLALLPEAIVWSGRARFYAQLQFFVLLAIWAAYKMIVDSAAEGSRATRNRSWLFAALFILALFSQEETVLLYPALLLATILWWGWHFLLRPPVFVTHLICLAAMGIRFAIEILGQPGYFEIIQAERPYIGLIFDWQGAWDTYSPLLIAPERLPWTLCGLVAVSVALVALSQARWRLPDLDRFHQATLFFALLFYFVLAVIFIFVGGTWRDSRYLFLVQPFWLLIGAAGALWLVERLVVATIGRLVLPIMTMLTLLAGASLYPAAQQAVTQQVEGYDRALAWLAQARQSDDIVLSPQPPACALVMGRCDYYAAQHGYEEYVIKRNGVRIDRWTGSPLLNTTEQLAAALRNAPRTWFVSDSLRLATRYDADFVRTVIEQFDLAFLERGVMVLRADGWRTSPTPVVTQSINPPVLFTPLALTGWERTEATPGQALDVMLFWQGTQPIDRQFNTSLKVVAANGETVQQADSAPARGLIPTTLFFATPRPDPKTLSLPANLAPGRYRLEVSVYEVATVTPLREPYTLDWFTVGPPPAVPTQRIMARWSNGLQLVGMDTLPATIQPGETFQVRLVWTTDTPIDTPIEHDYTVFVHLVGADGQPIAQSDRAPEGGFYPTSAWEVGEWVADQYVLTVPANTPAGEYPLIVGFYRPETPGRLVLDGGNDVFVLGTLRLTTTK